MKIAKTIIKGFSERLVIKTFKTNQAGHEFLNKQNSNDWHEYTGKLDKPGTYVFAGGEWRNVKTIDPSALAHM
jgi:hypothetical protein